ncbi:hypothetical protein M8J76_013473 [Diaphorina citri]|nr:hypothetical protein M8J75_007410 [Diaphorina citri]KAI5737424.1 hypothetical protein M8J76_013473 [Diaphorina citri]KAI5742306.1 hypothetical protein M8J77_005974 [Diaphorina citri]
MGFPLPVALILLGVACSYATQIKYIVRSGPFEASPELLADKWRREIHSMVGSADNNILPTTEATYQDCVLDGSCSDLQSDGFGAEGTFKPFPQDHLEKILKKFQKGDTKLANIYIDRSDVNEGIDNNDNQPQPLQEQPQSNDKSKSWNVINQQSPNKHPYDDRQGWVTLEPIAWSSSQIQKWEPNPRPTFPPPNEAANYWNPNPSPSKPSPSYGPPVSSERPPWNKPSYEYNTNKWGNNKWPANQNYEYKPTYSPGSNWGGNSDIITDNRPGSFPPDNRPSGSHENAGYRPWGGGGGGGQPSPSYNKPTYSYGNSNSYSSSSERPSSSYTSSADGDGHWVLLSSTKGYSIPQRHRSNSRSMNLKQLEDDKEFPKTITANVVNNMNS